MKPSYPMPPLNEREADVILRKGTEVPSSGQLTNNKACLLYTSAGSLITAWVLTLPAAGGIGFVSYWLLHFIWN